MASTYSSLKIQLMTTGENNTTWGDITNLNLGTAIEEAITGSADVSFLGVDVTLLLVDSPTSQTARNLRLNLTGTSGGARNLIVPAIEKFYIVNNGCADAVTIKNATGTGISVPAGKTAMVFNNGTNVVDAINYLSSLTTGTSIVAGTSIASGTSLAAGTSLAYTTTLTGGTGIVNLGSGQFYKDASGNVGVGTTSPVTYGKLAVVGTGTVTANIVGDSTSETQLKFFTNTAARISNQANTPLIFDTNNTERMRLTAAGLLGVGTNVPATQLDVRNGDITLSRTAAATAGDAALNFGNGGTAYIFAGNTSNIMAFAVNSSERMRIDASGNVGIGTSSPSTYGKLAVIGSIGASNYYISDQSTTASGAFGFSNANGPAIEMYGSASGGAGVLLLKTANTERMRITVAGDVAVGSATTTAAAGIRYFDVVNLENTNNSSAADIRLITQNVAGSGTVAVDLAKTKGGAFSINNTETNAAAFTSFGVGASERMRIDSSGNVGIGTSSPAVKLDVVGTIYSRPGGAAGAVAVLTADATSGLNGISLSAGFTSGGYGPIAFSTTATERMRIDASGNVGIGTNAPGARFDVGGGGNMVMTGATTTDQLIRVGAVRTGNGYSYLDLQGDTTYVDGLRLLRGNTGANTFSSLTHRGTGPLSLQTSEAGPITINTTSLERVRVTAAGDVGIGTSAPNYKLQAAGLVSSLTSAQAGYHLYNNGAVSEWFMGQRSAANHSLSFSTLIASTYTDRMVIDTSGNVGIGTTGTYQLQVKGTGQETAALTDAGLKGGSLYLQGTAVGAGSGGAVLFGTTFANSTPFAAIKGFVEDGTTNTVGSLRFSTRNAIADTALTERAKLTIGGDFLLTSSGGLGYGTGSGGAVTQLTSRTTGVTLNKTNGAITMFSAAGNASPQTFVVTNSTVAATDVVVVSVRSSTNVYFVACTSTSAGAFAICFYSLSGTATDAPVINFAVIKAVTA